MLGFVRIINGISIPRDCSVMVSSQALAQHDVLTHFYGVGGAGFFGAFSMCEALVQAAARRLLNLD